MAWRGGGGDPAWSGGGGDGLVGRRRRYQAVVQVRSSEYVVGAGRARRLPSTGAILCDDRACMK
jgi:hypothetical protein